MKIKLPTKGLARLLNIVRRATAKTTTMPILSGILIEAKDGTLGFSATDMEISYSIRAAAGGPLTIEEEGTVVVPAGVFSQVVASLPDGEVVLAADHEAGVVRLTQGKNEYSLRYYAADDYPKLPAFPAEGAFDLPAEELMETVGRVVESASKDDTRPIITGILVSFSEGALNMVATDSYRLSIKQTQLPEGSEGPIKETSALIPARAMAEAVKVAQLSQNEQPVRVAILENTALFSAGGAVLSTRLIAGNFPEYDRLMPSTFAHEFSVDASALADSVKRANLFANRQSPPVPLRLEFDSGTGSLEGATLTVSADSQDFGAAREKLGAIPVPGGGPEGNEAGGEPFSISFNGNYLARGIASCASKRVRIHCNDPLKPAVITPESKEGNEPFGAPSFDGFRYLIMPMRDNSSPERPAAKKPAAKPEPARA